MQHTISDRGGISHNLSPKIHLTANVLFSGIGCQERGIEDTGLFDLEVVNTSEIDKEAIVSYAAIHHGLTLDMVENYAEYPTRDEMAKWLSDHGIGYDPVKNKPYDWNKLIKRKAKLIEKYWLACKINRNLGDIRSIERLEYADLWTLSAPCTDISVAGKLKGLNPDDETRSSLIWQNIRLLERAKEDNLLPKYLFLENVKNLVGKQFKKDFETFNELLSDFGYNVYWQVLNAKDCGVPQNRERVFAIYIRKDIDTGRFTFPKPFDNGLRLKDVLEEKVDEKYYIKTQKAQDLIKELLDKGVIGNDALDRQTGVDLSLKDTRNIDTSNCISARQDRGISNRRSEGSDVCELCKG